jgi:hypothetical protein
MRAIKSKMGGPEGNGREQSLGRSRYKWEDNINKDLK